MSDTTWDLIVVGGGHAGCEAALAAARMGQRTLMLTQSVDQIGAMSCNPAIGGLAKGHLVKEIDALGGAMGLAADQTAIQFRTLNAKKGAAVQATRTQTDMIAYKSVMRQMLEAQEGLTIEQGEAASLLIENDSIQGLTTLLGERLQAKAVAICSGTFLNGLIHIGHQQFAGGRTWEFPSTELAQSIRSLGLKWGRLKTGTTPRLDGRSIDFSKLEEQPGDPETRPFSFWETSVPLRQVPCHIAFTGAKTQEIIEANIEKSAMYSGAITGVGPRYCPSIEDKIKKFPDKERHQTFIEPTSLESNEYYPNGMSTSLPLDVQYQFMRSIPGLEKVIIVRPGYAIEYDFVEPTQLKSSLESKAIEGLFLAGQVNGTSGYEEAAAQGLMAGINAALKNRGEEPLVLLRNEAYIGVLIDDLVSKGTQEPYRMFTSRAEYRLLLREDNADLRLTEKGRAIGLIDDAKWQRFEKRLENLERLKAYMQETHILPTEEAKALMPEEGPEILPHRLKLDAFVRKPGGTLKLAESIPGQEQLEALKDFSELDKFTAETEFKYEGYVQRQESQVKKYLQVESVKVPDDFDYDKVGGLSTEVIQKLKEHRPQNLGQAQKISGVTPAAITILMVAIQKNGTKQKGD